MSAYAYSILPYPWGVGRLLVHVVRNAVEFQEPVLESCLGIKLSGSELAGLWVPGENGFRPRATGRRANAQNVLESRCIVLSVQHPRKVCTFVEHPIRQVDESGDFQFLGSRLFPKRRLELEGTDAAAADVAEPIDRVEGLWALASCRQPRVDQPVAELVRQCICQHSRQTPEGFLVERRELIRCFSGGHLQRRNLNGGVDESRVVLENPKGARFVPGHRPDACAPEDNIRVSHPRRHPRSRSLAGLPLASDVPFGVQNGSARRVRLGGFHPSVLRRGLHRPGPAPTRHAGRCRGSMVRRPRDAAMYAHRSRRLLPAWIASRCGTVAIVPDGIRSRFRFVGMSSYGLKRQVMTCYIRKSYIEGRI